jgi:hypothetical protein
MGLVTSLGWSVPVGEVGDEDEGMTGREMVCGASWRDCGPRIFSRPDTFTSGVSEKDES